MRDILLRDADAIVDEVVGLLAQHCHSLQVVGSVRRRSPMIGDIDIACAPCAGGAENGVSFGFIKAVDSFEKVRGEATGRFTQRLLPNGRILDVFMSKPENFGTMVAFRTGSTAFYKRTFSAKISYLKFKVVGGALFDQDGVHVPAYDEDEFFRILDVPWRAPELRGF